MADTKTPAERSENMSRIRSTNTKPEEIVRKYLFSHGFRYRKNDKRYPGKPDIVLPKYHTIIFCQRMLLAYAWLLPLQTSSFQSRILEAQN